MCSHAALPTTAQLLRSLISAMRAGRPNAIVSCFELLIENFRNVMDVEFAGLGTSLPEIVAHYVSAPEAAIRRNAVRLVAQGIATLIAVENATPLSARLLTIYLKLLRDHVLATPQRADLLEDVFEALLQVSRSTNEYYPRVMVSTIPLSALKISSIDRLTPRALSCLVEVVCNLSGRTPPLMRTKEKLELLAYILEHGRVRCEDVIRICESLHQHFDFEPPVLFRRIVVVTPTLLSGLMSHCCNSPNYCTRRCLEDVATLMGALLNDDDEEVIRVFLHQEVPRLPALAASLLPDRAHQLLGTLTVVTRCLSGSQSLMDEVLRHQLLNLSIPLLAHINPGVRRVATNLVSRFVAVADSFHIVRAFGMGLLQHIAHLLNNEETTVQRITLELLEQIWQRFLSLDVRDAAINGMRTSGIHNILLSLMNSYDAGIRNSARILESHLHFAPNPAKRRRS